MTLTANTRRRVRRLALLLFVGVLPAALLCVGIVHSVFNHFFAHAPYLLDAGWYSDVVHRAGLSPSNPRIACVYADAYFGVHVSPYISAFSILSYVVPLPRIEWYALFQAIVFLPFGVATYALVSRIEPDRKLWALPITIVAALAFTFNGQILRMILYPHYEVAIAGFDCLLLAMLVTGRTRWAWTFFVLALSVREDAGAHTALALAPLVYLKWRGFELLPRMRTLIVMFCVGVGATVVGVMCHKLVFDGASIMSMVYLGDPLYGHIDGAALATRAQAFLESCQFMYYPFLATCLVAALRRDAHYLLGWAAGAPWFVLNFLAAQEQKAVFDSYSGFPYVVSIFWVLVYGAVLAPGARRLRPPVVEATFAVVCLSATLGLYRGSPTQMEYMADELVHTLPMNRPAVHRFVAVLDERRADFGRLYVDYSVAALALESVRSLDNAWTPGVRRADTIAFHAETVVRDELLPDLLGNRLDFCTRIVGTGIFVCTRDRLPSATFAGLETWVVPPTFTFATLERAGIGVDAHGITHRNGATVDGWLGRLPRGTYELTWRLETDPAIDASGTDLATVEILVGSDIRVSHTVPIGSPELSFRFEASGAETFWFRSASRIRSKLTVTDAQIRPL